MTPYPSVVLGKWQPLHRFSCSLTQLAHVLHICNSTCCSRTTGYYSSFSPKASLHRANFNILWSLEFYSNHVFCNTTAPTRSYEPQAAGVGCSLPWLHWTWCSHNCKNYESNYSDFLFYFVRRRNSHKVLQLFFCTI